MTRVLADDPCSEPLNVWSGSSESVGRILSNFTRSHFAIDGVAYASVEGFWSALGFPEGSLERAGAARLWGARAKANRPKGNGTTVYFGGQELERGSSRHRDLLYIALEARCEQVGEQRTALLTTRGRYVTHVVPRGDGSPAPDSTTIPGAVLADMLMCIRDRL